MGLYRPPRGAYYVRKDEILLLCRRLTNEKVNGVGAESSTARAEDKARGFSMKKNQKEKSCRKGLSHDVLAELNAV